MSDFSLMPWREGLGSSWDAVVRNSRNGNFLNQRDYMGYHADRFDECSVIVRRCEEPVALFPANRLGELVVSHGGLTYGGLLYGVDACRRGA